VPGATHLFEEPGTLESAANLATSWFVDHLGLTGQPAAGQGSAGPEHG
jgi:putative phosphoribosyl transferase